VNEKNRKRPDTETGQEKKKIYLSRAIFSFTFLSSLFEHKHAPARNKTKQNKTIKAFVKTCNSYAIRVLRSYSLYSNIESKRAACFERRIFFCFSKEKERGDGFFFCIFFFLRPGSSCDEIKKASGVSVCDLEREFSFDFRREA
jgi:hypothetical protein